jgi:hypothetical protein
VIYFCTMEEPLNEIKNRAGPCGIVCGSCPLGSGSVAEAAAKTRKHIVDCQIPMWSPFVPGGEVIDWTGVDRGLDWMEKYARCAGCESGGGPPDCTIRICARERGCELCSSCTKFEWLKEHGSQLRQQLAENRGLSKEEYIKKMVAKMPWEA